MISVKDQEAPRRTRHPLSIQEIGKETLVYDEHRHKAFCLNEGSSVIWRLADGERTVAEMGVAASLALGNPVSDEFILFALDELRRDGLIEAGSTGFEPAISRRTMLQNLGVGGAMLLPAIASIVAPTAAQAQSGCVDCSDVQSSRAARARRQQLSGTNQSGVVSPSEAPQK